MYPFGNTQNQNQIQDQIQRMLMTQPVNQQSQEKHVVKVNGRAGADNYYLPPNSDDILLDLNEPIAWFVQTDGAGYKTITPYDISPHKETSQSDILKSMEDRITRLEEAMKHGKSNYPAANTKPERQHNDASNRSNAQG